MLRIVLTDVTFSNGNQAWKLLIQLTRDLRDWSKTEKPLKEIINERNIHTHFTCTWSINELNIHNNGKKNWVVNLALTRGTLFENYESLDYYQRGLIKEENVLPI